MKPAPIKEFKFEFGKVKYSLGRKTHIMGILNVTPDSFSDGGTFFDPHRAIEQGLWMVDEGADFIDIGGESTRPGSDDVSADEELRRVLPVVKGLSEKIEIPISIDTRKSAVAQEALKAGASIVNDISGLTADPHMAGVVASANASLVIMHMKGNPKTMQANPTYSDVVVEISEFLLRQAKSAERAGINQVIIDPGIGFGKNLEHNLTIFRRLNEFTTLGYPLMVGPSRKSFIGALLDVPVHDRVEGTAAAVAASVLGGASIVRVHDVKEMKRVAAVCDELKK
jgi:dihydropteroate synthase